MNPLISVIIPIYNVGKHLEKCVDSVLQQDFYDVEVILVDDGSTDGCAEICDKYAEEDSRIKVIHKTNGGLVSARKAGALASTGKYIATVDGDDGVTELFFEKLCDAIKRWSPDLILFDSVEIRGDNVKPCYSFLREGYYDRNQIEQELFSCLIEDKMSRYVTPSQNHMVFLREIYMECEMQIDDRISIGEDGVCTKPAIYRANSLYVLHDCLSIYNINSSSMTKGGRVYDIMWSYYAAKQYEKMIDVNQFDFKEQIYRYVTHNLFVSCVTQYYKKSSYRLIKKELNGVLDNDYYITAVNNCRFSIRNLKGNMAKYCLKNRWYLIMKLNCMFLYHQ